MTSLTEQKEETNQKIQLLRNPQIKVYKDGSYSVDCISYSLVIPIM